MHVANQPGLKEVAMILQDFKHRGVDEHPLPPSTLEWCTRLVSADGVLELSTPAWT